MGAIPRRVTSPGKPGSRSIPLRVHYTCWTDQENIERYGVEIIADEVTFLSLSLGLSRSRQSQGGTQDHGGLDDDDIPL